MHARNVLFVQAGQGITFGCYLHTLLAHTHTHTHTHTITLDLSAIRRPSGGEATGDPIHHAPSSRREPRGVASPAQVPKRRSKLLPH